MSYRTDIQVRFSDTDALGHLNNTAYALYAEQARVELFHGLGQKGNLILAHIALDFRRQARYGDRVHVLTWVDSIGNSSVRLYQEVYADDLVTAQVASVVVMFDYVAQRPIPVPEALRRSLEPYRREATLP